MHHNVFPKIAVINDFTGFGRCALSVEIPIISQMGLQCCGVPTSILSNHSAFSSFFYHDYTDYMEDYVGEWKKLGLQFEGILTGFYGSERQIDFVKEFIKNFSNEKTVVVVDPIMGDNGKTYATYTKKLCDKMKELTEYAHILTPNLTELCILSGNTYGDNYSYEEIAAMCKQAVLGRKDCKVVVTGIVRGKSIVNLVYENNGYCLIRKKIAGENRCGTGDVFASVVTGKVVCKESLKTAVKTAADFVSRCIVESDKIGIPKTDGVCFEKLLYQLKGRDL